MCSLLNVSRSGYYAWRRRPPSARSRADAGLTKRIREIHAASYETYGAPRIHAALRADGTRTSRKRVARLMRTAGLHGSSRRRYRGAPKPRPPVAAPAPDHVQQDFTAEAPDQVWVADLTQIPTQSGRSHLAVVLDVFSRRVVGWAVASHCRTNLVVDALRQAVQSRQPEGVIHHSDRGSQYTSILFGQRCREVGIVRSMGRVATCYDNAMCESFFATLKTEWTHRQSYRTPAEVQLSLFSYIEGWYNYRRLHSKIGYVSPVAYEEAHAAEETHAATCRALRSSPARAA